MSSGYNSVTSSERFSVTVLAMDGTLDHFAHFLYDLVWPLYHWMYVHGKLYDTGITIIVRDERARRYFYFLNELFHCSFLFGKDKSEGACPIVLLGMESSNRQYIGLNLSHLIADRAQYLKDFQNFVFDRLGVEKGEPNRLVLVERKERSEPGDKKEGPVAGRGADRRAIVNHDEVRNALVKFSEEVGLTFQNVVLGEMGLKEQVEAFANARVAVGQHGAGMHHVLWMPKGSLLQEVHKGTGDFYRLRRVCDFFKHAKHQKMVCPVTDRSTTQGSIKVNTEQLVQKLRKGMGI